MSASASPIPYTGSKSCIVKTILDVMPPHETYIEPCMGSAEVFFRKPPADREIINDYNGDLVNLFRVLQDNQNLDKVIGRLYLSLNAELLFKQNKELLTNTPNILDDLKETAESMRSASWEEIKSAVAFFENQVRYGMFSICSTASGTLFPSDRARRNSVQMKQHIRLISCAWVSAEPSPANCAVSASSRP